MVRSVRQSAAPLPMAAAVVAVALSSHAAWGQTQPGWPMEPLIRIETGVHTATVKGIGVDQACTRAITGGDDKTARLWSIPPGGGAPVLLRTLRPQIGYGDFGKVYTVDMTADGTLAAVSGWTRTNEHYVLLFDTSTGSLITELGPLQNVVNRVVFSPSGRHLAAVTGQGHGVVAWERQGAADWRKVLEDKDFGGRDSYGVAFAADGRLFAVGDDASLRSYDRAFKRQRKVTTTGGREPYSIAVHPNGKLVAVGHDDSHAVEIYDAETLQLLHTAKPLADPKGNLSSVAWSRDGNVLWAGGTSAQNSMRVLRAWDAVGRGPGATYATRSENTIRQVVTCADRLAFVAADPAWGLVSSAGADAGWIGPRQVDMRRKIDQAFSASANGLQVRFGLEYAGDKPAILDLAASTLSDAPQMPSGFATPRTSGLAVTDWKDNRTPKLNGTVIKLNEYEDSRSMAVASDASGFVLGTSWNIRSYDAQGRERWKKSTTGTVWGVNFVAGNRLLILALGDGTLRWLRMSDGRELLAAFVDPVDRRWVAWTPRGYYMASPKGDELIGWHQNKGFGRVADFRFAHERRGQFDRKDVVRQTIEGLDEEQAIARARK